MNSPKYPENFRDLGGIAGAGGRRVAPRRLLRSGELVGLSPADTKLLAEEYGLRRVIDLRGTAEREKRPDEVPPGADYHAIDLMRDIAPHAPGAGQMEEMVKRPGAMDKFMFEVYGLLIEDADARAGLRKLVELLAGLDEGAGLFHCFAGKDRAGMAAAVVLTVLGASREDIFTDYLRTNELRAEANKVLLAEAEKGGASDEVLFAIGTAISVKPQFLERAFEVAEKNHGSFEGYVTEGIGVDRDMAEAFREKYLV